MLGESLAPEVRLQTEVVMVSAESIKQSIEAGVACQHLEVVGDGEHFQALIVSEDFAGRTRVQRHQLVYAALGDRMREEIHALSMRTLTPQEWRSGG
jgi:acid stress-induced BolA-like protein IbaG/YrbA